MQQKDLSLNDMLPFWWFVTWRTMAVTIVVAVILNILAQALGEIIAASFPFLNFIVLLVAQLYFMKKAVNRSYPSRNMRITVQSGSTTPVS